MSDPERQKSNKTDTDFIASGITRRGSGKLPDRGVVFDPSKNPNSGDTSTLERYLKLAREQMIKHPGKPLDPQKVRSELRVSKQRASEIRRQLKDAENDLPPSVPEYIRRAKKTKTLSKNAPKRNPEDAKRLRNEHRLGYIEASKKAGTTEGDMGKVVNELVKKGEAIRLRKPKRTIEEIERTKGKIKSLYNAGFTYGNKFYNLGFTYDEISEIINEPYHIVTNSMERLTADNAVTRRVRHGSSVSRERLQIDAKKIEETRVAKGISKNKLARELGVGKSHIRELIKGNIKTVKPAVMKRLEDMLGVDPGSLQSSPTNSS